VKILAIVLALVFLVLAILTATGIASFHSHILAVLGLDGAKHLKHTILYAVLAILCFIWARFASAK
jgi:hypothetical protein